MSITRLPANVLLYAVGVLLAVVATLSVGLVIQNARHGQKVAELTAQRDSCGTSLKSAQSALATTVETNTRQQAAVEALARKLDAAIRETENLDQLLVRAEADLHQTQRARDAALAQLETHRENVYATDASCSAWGAAAVCGAITGSLQDQWRAATGRR